MQDISIDGHDFKRTEGTKLSTNLMVKIDHIKRPSVSFSPVIETEMDKSLLPKPRKLKEYRPRKRKKDPFQPILYSQTKEIIKPISKIDQMKEDGNYSTLVQRIVHGYKKDKKLAKDTKWKNSVNQVSDPFQWRDNRVHHLDAAIKDHEFLLKVRKARKEHVVEEIQKKQRMKKIRHQFLAQQKRNLLDRIYCKEPKIMKDLDNLSTKSSMASSVSLNNSKNEDTYSFKQSSPRNLKSSSSYRRYNSSSTLSRVTGLEQRPATSYKDSVVVRRLYQDISRAEKLQSISERAKGRQQFVVIKKKRKKQGGGNRTVDQKTIQQLEEFENRLD